MRGSRFLSAAVVGVVAALSAFAQYPPPPPGYAPYGGYPVLRGPGATLQGSASVIQAQGNLQIQQQQARSAYQQSEQDKLKTRKQAFDLAAYEKANTPSFTEEQEGVQAMQLRRMMTQANDAEIARGDTLNAMLPVLRSYEEQGVSGPPLPLSPSVLQAVNVSSSATDPGLGLLKDGGKVRWPVMLRGPQQKKIDGLLQSTIALAAKDELTPQTYNALMKEVKGFQEDWRKEFHKEKIDGGTFLNGKKFLDSMEQSVKALQNPDAVQYLNGSLAARGNNVQELVYNMTSKGLRFAPANPGQESAYQALHASFVSYARAGQAGAGLTTAAAIPAPPKK